MSSACCASTRASVDESSGASGSYGPYPSALSILVKGESMEHAGLVRTK